MASDKGSDEVAANEYVDLDRRQSSRAIAKGSVPGSQHARYTMRRHDTLIRDSARNPVAFQPTRGHSRRSETS
jgi:hypothetical protein